MCVWVTTQHESCGLCHDRVLTQALKQRLAARRQGDSLIALGLDVVVADELLAE